MPYQPYLFFGGNCREAFTRYQEIFGGELDAVDRHADMPGEERPPADTGDLIMHAALVGDDDDLLMGSDDPTTDSFGPVQGMQVNYSPRPTSTRPSGCSTRSPTAAPSTWSRRPPAGRRTSACCPTGSARRG